MPSLADRLVRAKTLGLTRRETLAGLAATMVLLPHRSHAATRAALPAADTVLRTITFGSCCKQTVAQPIWDVIAAQNPDLFLFLGDNVYLDAKLGDVRGDATDPAWVQAAYNMLAAQPQFAAFRAKTPILATWDDHDFGLDDAGKEFPAKEETRRIFCDFFGVPADSPRRTRPDGLYDAMTFGPEGRRTQIILLDLRWNRTPLAMVPDEVVPVREAMSMGPYLPTNAPDATMLGEAQWAWLEERLREPADVRLIGTSLPFVMEGTGWEIWANMPAEKQRMLDLITATRAQGVVFLSGDTHWAEFSRLDKGAPYPIWDITSSGLTEEWDQIATNPYRVEAFYWRRNFGKLAIDWESGTLHAVIHNADGLPVIGHKIPLASLRA